MLFDGILEERWAHISILKLTNKHWQIYLFLSPDRIISTAALRKTEQWHEANRHGSSWLRICLWSENVVYVSVGCVYFSKLPRANNAKERKQSVIGVLKFGFVNWKLGPLFLTALPSIWKELCGKNKLKDDCLDSRSPKITTGNQSSQFLRRRGKCWSLLQKSWTMSFKRKCRVVNVESNNEGSTE